MFPYVSPYDPSSLHPTEGYHCLRGCVRRVERTREHDTHLLKRGVIGLLQSHIDNMCLFTSFSLLIHTHRYTQTFLFPENCQCWRGCVWGMSRAGEHDMLIKERSYRPGPLTRRKWQEQLLWVPAQEKWRQKRGEQTSREGVMKVHQKENKQETEVYLPWLF